MWFETVMNDLHSAESYIDVHKEFGSYIIVKIKSLILA